MEGRESRVHVFSPAMLRNKGQRSELQKGAAHAKPPLSQGLQTSHGRSLESCGSAIPGMRRPWIPWGPWGSRLGCSVRWVQHLIISHTSPLSARGQVWDPPLRLGRGR